MKHKGVTDNILKAYYNVYNTLGFGFLEKVYEHALLLELQKMGLHAEAQFPIIVHYDGKEVGQYFADIIVGKIVILELKAVDTLSEEHSYQLINYLKATDIEVGLLLNFGKRPQVKRKIFDNEYKKSIQIH
ncbi:MAG: GxxExxY protein [Candidatus Magasanikbacteria bacterium CG_4_9_14_0_2_um_filter_42_11]|uniref:GxxExxY protein n=1 Tax=Candidatus Magasanikbacteria bacterium CG_4_9_14_0_2_um_filter_42_11 TaxID=1974643 RepID=A0A2M8FAS3_9BACT|nr:MAG: GxxExxY protein [Candidatus Magasanikbacteria bacterium CG10_big_fil_rev_8_21_14_0_10_43_9]PIY92907.1 MAG: GxxExxY protein [Candidatus Magasanikbacteria bacterium CG_4_10_14_0_8_um_filter_42_12]PJC52769.1 MAG: GxxExxY protein [Candidatus Magasanikbacteria bacterium CG_4_9_14_0_2_um_filter_42_11]